MKSARIVVAVVLGVLVIAWLAYRTGRERGADRAGREPREERAATPRDETEDRADLAQEVLVPPQVPLPAPEMSAPIAAEYSAEDPVGIVVYGTVRAPDGTPIADSWILARGAENATRRATVAEGGFSLAGLRPGSWVISSDAQGIGKIERTIDLSENQPLVRLDLVLEGSTLVLVRFVCPDGTPLLERLIQEKLFPGFSLPLAVVATTEPPGPELPAIGHRSHDRFGLGEFRMRGRLGADKSIEIGYDGVVETAISPPYCLSAVMRHLVLDTVPVAPGDTEVVFTIAPEEVLGLFCRVRARILDVETGEPLIGARATVGTSQGGGGGGRVEADGSLVVERAFPGPLLLEVHAPNHESYDLWFVASPPETDLGEILLHPATGVSGTVVDESGSPVECSFTWRDLDRRDRDGAELFRYGRRSMQSDTDGSFAIRDLGRSRYLLHPSPPFARNPILLDVRGGPVEGLVVPVSAGAEVKIITGVEPGVLVDAWVEDERGFSILADQVSARISLRLAPGRYSVRVEGGGRVRRATFTVGSEPLEVTVGP